MTNVKKKLQILMRQKNIQLDEYGEYYYTTNSEWFDEHSTWRSIFFSFPENNK